MGGIKKHKSLLEKLAGIGALGGGAWMLKALGIATVVGVILVPIGIWLLSKKSEKKKR